MAVARPRPEDVATLICESCHWTEPKASALKWTRVMGKDLCDICSPRLDAEAKAKREAKRKKAA